mmetsp:Transcript_51682/g.129694  ORF Transcript_51682/g.129694 Transcript_51682/m.129694 type:complete len:281 (-) Transcript_51682:15-857(-)
MAGVLDLEDLFRQPTRTLGPQAPLIERPPFERLDMQQVLSALQSHHKHNGVQLDGFTRLATLAQQVYNAYLFHEHDGYSVVIRAMQQHSADVRLVTMALLVLGTVLRQLPVYATSRDLVQLEVPIAHLVPMIRTALTVTREYDAVPGVLCYGSFLLGALLQCGTGCVLPPTQRREITAELLSETAALRCIAAACTCFAGDFYLLCNALEAFSLLKPLLSTVPGSECAEGTNEERIWIQRIEATMDAVDFDRVPSSSDHEALKDAARAKLLWTQCHSGEAA